MAEPDALLPWVPLFKVGSLWFTGIILSWQAKGLLEGLEKSPPPACLSFEGLQKEELCVAGNRLIFPLHLKLWKLHGS